jgi:hypothetical protein
MHVFFYITPQAKIKRFQTGINISFPHSVTSKHYQIGLWIPFFSTKQHIQKCIHLTVCYAIRKRIFTTKWVLTITVLIYNNVHHNEDEAVNNQRELCSTYFYIFDKLRFTKKKSQKHSIFIRKYCCMRRIIFLKPWRETLVTSSVTQSPMWWS